MSFFRKLFGGGKDEAPRAPERSAPATPPAPKLDLSCADALRDCSGIDWNEGEQLHFLEEYLGPRVGDRLAPLLLSEPFRDNPVIPPVDAAVIYAMCARYEPGRIMEVGSGYSTLVFRHAKQSLMLPGELIAVAKNPPVDIGEHVDAQLFYNVEELPVDDFTIMMEDEVLFLNTTHIHHAGTGDVAYLFDTALPALAKGVIVGLTNVRLPREYTRGELEKGFNEQERLVAYLREHRPEILFAGAWLREHHGGALDEALPPPCRGGESHTLWFRVR